MMLLEYHKDLVTLIGSFTKIRGLPTFTHFLSILHILSITYVIIFLFLMHYFFKSKKKKKKRSFEKGKLLYDKN